MASASPRCQWAARRPVRGGWQPRRAWSGEEGLLLVCFAATVAPQSQAGAAEGMAFTMASLTAALPARLRRNAAPAKAPLLVSWEGGFRRSAGVLDTPSAGASPTQRRQRVVATRREPSSQACAASRARLPCRGLWRPRVLATAGALFRALADAALLSQTARLRWVLTTGASGP